MNLSASVYERLAALPVDQWRWITNHMAWRYRKDAGGLPPREDWLAMLKAVKPLRDRIARERKAQRLEHRLSYKREYMRRYRQRKRQP